VRKLKKILRFAECTKRKKGTKQNNTELSTTQQSGTIFPTLTFLTTLS